MEQTNLAERTLLLDLRVGMEKLAHAGHKY